MKSLIIVACCLFAACSGSAHEGTLRHLGEGVVPKGHPAPCFRQSFQDEFGGFNTFFASIVRYIRLGIQYITRRVTRSIFPDSVDATDEKISYRNYQVLRIEAINEDQVANLKALPNEVTGTELWTPPTENHFADLLVSPDSLEEVKAYLKDKKIDHEILIRDLEKVITYENPKMNNMQRNLLIGKRGHPMTWLRYHRYIDIRSYMEFLAFAYPEKVELITIGHTTNNLPIQLLKIHSKTSNLSDVGGKEGEPAVWIDGGMHGREWVTPAVVLYIARQLVENHRKHKDLVEIATWYLLPVANPDGYEYSHSMDRLWKKTRSTHESTASNFFSAYFFDVCEGVDLNRNFDYRWGEHGGSVDSCHEEYAGPRPMSEPEAKALADFVLSQRENLKIFVTLHSYSQKLLIPWRHSTRKPADYRDLERHAKKAARAIALVTGSHYDVGSSSQLLSLASGTVEDWAKGAAGIKYSYAIQLRDRGSYGFLLPAPQIVPTAKETFVAMKILVKLILGKNR